MNNTYCKYCWPTKRKSHFFLHLEYYVDRIGTSMLKPLKSLFLKNRKNYRDYLWALFIDILSLTRIVSFVDKPDESKLYNRSLIFFEEAKKRNLDVKAIKVLGKYINEFKLIYKNRRYYYESIPITVLEKACLDMEDKNNIRKLLQEDEIPIAPGKLFTNLTQALNFGSSIGFPLVVKPSNGSLSHHVVFPINSKEELLHAIKVAKKYRPAFIIEKYIEGKLYRATVVGRKHVFICQKDRANIVGDGYLTVKELIKMKNSHVSRGDTMQVNTTLHKIPIDDILIKNLKDQELSLQSVLSEDKKIYIQNKFILSHGCDIINCSEDTHIGNKNLFLKVANILKSDLVGIDFICPDISKSYKEQETAVLETNRLPYIDMHQYPSCGRPEPVAEIVWDTVLNSLDKD